MNSKKLLLPFTTFLFVTLILLGNFVFLLNNQSFYINEFEKLDINATQAISVVNYVNSKGELVDGFTPPEVSHLTDVRNLFSKLKIFYYLTLVLQFAVVIYLFTSKKFKIILPKSFVISGVFSLIFLLVLFLLSLSFDTFFTNLHKPFFTANTWIFPQDSLLIQLYPVEFFQDFTNNLFRLIFFNAAVFFGIGLFIRKKFKQPQQLQSNDA